VHYQSGEGAVHAPSSGARPPGIDHRAMRLPANGLIPHRWSGPPIFATLVDRPNKFLAICRIGHGAVEAHVPDRGRCLDLLLPGQPLVLVEAAVQPGMPPRRTRYTVLLARARTPPSPWVSLDPAGAPRLVAAALERDLLPELAGHSVVGRELTLPRLRARPRPRIDLLLRAPTGEDVPCEVKSVGAARDGVALFPDAPTLRGLRHLALLARRARRGLRAALVLCAQRGDVRAIAADETIDPAFARALRSARRAGVLIAGMRCAAHPGGMELLGPVPVL
jgi:sugar fermentation stimulation protein A